jgi:HD superfamily phosphodiesterase
MMIDGTVRRTMKPDQPDWLIELQNDMSIITAEEARKLWPGPNPHSGPFYNYRLEHVQQVERDVLRLEKEVGGADTDILLAAVWIHDRFQPQYEGNNHASRAAQWARENLPVLGFPHEKIETVAFAVARHSDPPGLIPSAVTEARLLWDADKLTKIGTVGVVTYLCGHPAFRDVRTSFTSMALHGLEHLDHSRKMVNQFYYECSRKIAQERYEEEKAFYEGFAKAVEA